MIYSELKRSKFDDNFSANRVEMLMLERMRKTFRAKAKSLLLEISRQSHLIEQTPAILILSLFSQQTFVLTTSLKKASISSSQHFEILAFHIFCSETRDSRLNPHYH